MNKHDDEVILVTTTYSCKHSQNYQHLFDRVLQARAFFCDRLMIKHSSYILDFSWYYLCNILNYGNITVTSCRTGECDNIFYLLNSDLNRGCLFYIFSLRFSGSKFLINLRRQFRVHRIFRIKVLQDLQSYFVLKITISKMRNLCYRLLFY